MQEIVISFVAIVARKYLGSKQVTILVSAKQPRNIYAVISIMKP